MPTDIYQVSGMTCEHCVASVSEEIREIPSVTGVEVELATGSVTVTSSIALDRADLEAAITGAGYQLV